MIIFLDIDSCVMFVKKYKINIEHVKLGKQKFYINMNEVNQMTVEDLAKQMMFLLEQGKGHYKIHLYEDVLMRIKESQSFELNDEVEGVLIY